jgi:hypothetical protein
MRKGVRYFFGRLNLIPTQEPRRKIELVRDALSHNTTIERRGVVWGFYQVRELETSLGGVTHGYLVKYKPHTQEEIAVPETRELDEQTINNRVSAKARFFLHVSSGLIAYHSFGREIRRDTFCDRFAHLFEEALGNFFVDAEILTIDEQWRIFEVLRRFRRISKVSIYLHPANPDLTEVTRNIQNRLKKLEADVYIEKYEAAASKVGLNVVEDPEINSKISMAADGYGRAEVTGTIDGEELTVSTANNPVTAISGGDDVPAEAVFEHLTPTIRRVFSRYDK